MPPEATRPPTPSPADTHTALIELADPYWLVVPLVLAVGGSIFGVLTAPALHEGQPKPEWFPSFFNTAASVIAAVFIALAVEARYVRANQGLAITILILVALGEIAAVSGLSGSLPLASYKWLLGVAIGCGLAALIAAIMIAGQAISADIKAIRAQRLGDLTSRSAPEANDK
jgi:hypothetical protein